MHLSKLSVKNFRALDDIDVEFGPGINVIVGPNAIGKTTVLEAIRLPRVLLSGRTPSEATQAMVGLGAAVQHSPRQLIPGALAGDVKRPLQIESMYVLTEDEVDIVEKRAAQLATELALAMMGQNIGASDASTYLSSQQGKEALQRTEKSVAEVIDRIRRNSRNCPLNLEMNFETGRVQTGDLFSSAIIGFLERRLPANLTSFSYFPADRALPRGEQPVQLGAQDAIQQLQSYNESPQLKYSRLKNTIFSMLVATPGGRDEIAAAFAAIFSGLLPGKEFEGTGINRYGQLSINIKDSKSSRIFDIDAMSSGEKGLILMFLLIGKSMTKNGLVLLDEPELHLNPAVCRMLLGFMQNKYVKDLQLQIILCSHSPEILSGALDKDDCRLFRLKSGTSLDRILAADKGEVAEALQGLGTSQAQSLLYKGTIFVEGPTDVSILEAGFDHLLSEFELRDLGGRMEVEKQIRRLQEAEAGQLNLGKYLFIFDRDRMPSQLRESKSVKFLQWQRYCLENYLIDPLVLSDLLQLDSVIREKIGPRAEITRKLKELAMGQLKEVVASEVYAGFQYESPGVRTSEIKGVGFGEIAHILAVRLTRIQSHIGQFNEDRWQEEFCRRCEAKYGELHAEWDTRWPELCNGKRYFEDLRSEVQLSISLEALKEKILSKLREHPPKENWIQMEALIADLIRRSMTS